MQAPLELHPYLLQVEPLPDHAALAAARRLHSQLRQSISLETDLCNFAARVRAMPEGLRARSLQHLCDQLDDGKLTQGASSIAQRWVLYIVLDFVGTCKPG